MSVNLSSVIGTGVPRLGIPVYSDHAIAAHIAYFAKISILHILAFPKSHFPHMRQFPDM